MKTEKGDLELGIEYPADSGTIHTSFEIRLLTVDEQIEVYEQPDVLAGGVAQMRVTRNMLAYGLMSLGTIPKEAITSELIGKMYGEDYDVLLAAQDSLRKKLRRPKPQTQSETSESPKSSSDSTALDTSVSDPSVPAN